MEENKYEGLTWIQRKHAVEEEAWHFKPVISYPELTSGDIMVYRKIEGQNKCVLYGDLENVLSRVNVSLDELIYLVSTNKTDNRGNYYTVFQGGV